MKDTIVDARGKLCPAPLILTKKALTSGEFSEGFILLLDNETAKENVERYLGDNKISYSTSSDNGIFTLTVKKSDSALPDTDPSIYCSPSSKDSAHIICIKSFSMGEGSDELGELLMKGFINTIGEVTPLPEKMVFYNGGVKLTTSSSPVIAALKVLEEHGVSILVCGTCLDYYQLKDELDVGTISNMYDITESLTQTGKVIYP